MLVAVLGAACSKDYVEPEFKTESFGLYASFFNHSNGGANINPTYLTPSSVEGIMDLSQGELSHEWSFYSGSEFVDSESGERTWTEMDSGVNFIKDNSNMGWGEIADFTPYLDPSISIPNSRDAITFMIPNGGVYKLRVRNTFASQIRYMYNVFDEIETSKRVNEYIDAVALSDGTYEVVREYEIQVYEPLTPSIKIYSDSEYAELVDMSQKATVDGVEVTEIYISVGDILYFKDTTGEDESGVSTIFTAPTNREWMWWCSQADNTPDAETATVFPISSTEQQQAFLFPAKGVYRTLLTTDRVAPTGASVNYPAASATSTMPVLIYVR